MDPYMRHCILLQAMSDSTENGTTSDTDVHKKNRGLTQMLDIWNMPAGEKYEIVCNEYGQPDDKMANKLSSFIGTIIRDGKNAPLIYKNWHDVPGAYKKTIWDKIQEKFIIPAHAKSWVMKKCGRKLSTWKAHIKKQYYSEQLSFEQQMLYKDKRVCDDQWEHLIKEWAKESAKTISARNKLSRGKKKYNHTTGTKSFARVRADKKKETGHSPSHVNLFQACHTRKDGSFNNDGTREVLLQLKDKDDQDVLQKTTRNDAFAQVMGKDKNGRVRMYGFGVCPTDVWEDTSSSKSFQATIEALQNEVTNLKFKLENLEAICSRGGANVLNDSANKSLQASNASILHMSKLSPLTHLSAEVGDKVLLKNLFNESETVAIGVLANKDPSTEIGGEQLGSDFVEVIVQVALKPDVHLIRKNDRFKTIGEVIGASIAWPWPFVITEDMDYSI